MVPAPSAVLMPGSPNPCGTFSRPTSKNSFTPFFQAKSLLIPKPRGKRAHPKAAQFQLSSSCRAPKSPSMTALPGLKSQHQSSSAAPFPTPPTISYTCQHSPILPAFLACHTRSGQAWPHSIEPIISKLSRRCRCCNQGELPPSYILGGSHFHPLGSKHGHSYLTYLWNQLQVIDMLNDCSRGYLRNCCHSKQLSVALL